MGISWSSANARRLQRHGLHPAAPSGTDLARVAARICGAHAQVLSAAEQSIALRVERATRGTVRRALWEDHKLIKTHGPRGTVHLLTTEDLPMWTAALSAIPTHSPFLDGVRLSAEQAKEIVAAIGDALENSELTLDELDQAVVERVGAWAGDRVMPAFQELWPRWRQAVALASHRGVLCYGPNRGRRVTYTNPHRWLPGFTPASEDEAIAKMIRDYLFAYGPATPQQFAQWIGAPPVWGVEQFGRYRQQLTEVIFESSPAWVAEGDTAMPPADDAASTVLLLPYFDAYVVGSHPRDSLFPGKATQRAGAPSGQAGNYPVLIIDGVVTGVWHQRRSGKRIDVTVEPLRPLTAVERKALQAQVDRTAEVMEGEPQLTIGIVTAGPHA
jgi:hypothetical protein